MTHDIRPTKWHLIQKTSMVVSAWTGRMEFAVTGKIHMSITSSKDSGAKGVVVDFKM